MDVKGELLVQLFYIERKLRNVTKTYLKQKLFSIYNQILRN